MVFKTVILCGLFFCCNAALEDPRIAKILDYQLEHTPSGHYFFRFESSDGTTREEEGNVLDENAEDSPVIVKGSYSYTDETGKVYTVRYIADENGFHPEGDHIQVPAYVVNPNPVNNKIALLATPRPVTPIQFIQTTPRPQFVPSEPSRFQVNAFTTTSRPEVSTSTRIQIPIEGSNGAKSTSFGDLDRKLQSSIVNLLANGHGRGFDVGAVNSV